MNPVVVSRLMMLLLAFIFMAGCESQFVPHKAWDDGQAPDTRITVVEPASDAMPKDLDSAARGEWWKLEPGTEFRPDWTAFLDVPRDETLAFALYTHDRGILKLTAQLYPLLPDESRSVVLEIDSGKGFEAVTVVPIFELGWSAHFRVEGWDSSKAARYRLRHGASELTGFVRPDPVHKREIVVGLLSCDSNKDRGDRDEIVRLIKHHDPDLLLFVGDQVYDHTQHTAAWLLWGSRYRDVLLDRPVVTLPDDHDVGQGNLWGSGGKAGNRAAGDAGGYRNHAEYVKMVERCQTSHLPDPFDPEPVEQGIGVYYTSLTVGGVGFALLEDRKFKSAPEWTLPKMGPRYDHVTDPDYERSSIDLPDLTLLGDRQLAFIDAWAEDWAGQEMKAVVSQTGFSGSAHLHGWFDNRLLADLDSNGWPQTGRAEALRAIRRAGAVHLAGDQHLSVVVQHGIDEHRDGPFAFVGPAVVNTYYQRWWWPSDERHGGNPIAGSPLPWTGDYLDGLGNRITMHAYANPAATEADQSETSARVDREDPGRYGDGLGIVRFDKAAQTITFEAWPRWTDPKSPASWQYPGWPITIEADQNDGREPLGYLPRIDAAGAETIVVQVVNEQTNETLYTKRVVAKGYRPPVFSDTAHTIRVGRDRPDRTVVQGMRMSGAAKDPIIVDLGESQRR